MEPDIHIPAAYKGIRLLSSGISEAYVDLHVHTKPQATPPPFLLLTSQVSTQNFLWGLSHPQASLQCCPPLDPGFPGGDWARTPPEHISCADSNPYTQ